MSAASPANRTDAARKAQAAAQAKAVLLAIGWLICVGFIGVFTKTWIGLSVVITLTIAGTAAVLFGRIKSNATPAVARISNLVAANPLTSALLYIAILIGVFLGRGMAQQDDDFDSMSPTQHLTAMKREHVGYSAAQRHLNAIPAGAPEYQEGQRIVAALDPTARRAREQAQRAAGAAAERKKAAADRQAAQDHEQEEADQFKAMSPAKHLAAAKEELAFGYDPKERIGGRLSEAQKHLEAIPKDAPEHKQSERLLREIDARSDRIAKVWLREERKKVAADLDQLFIKTGINVDSVQAAGKDHTILRINYALCSRVFFDRITPDEAIATWRAKGFTRIECHDGEESLSMNLK